MKPLSQEISQSKPLHSKTLVIVGSNRKNSNSEKIALWLKNHFDFDFKSAELPLWNESIFEKDSELQKAFEPIKQACNEAKSFIFLVPEYHGMANAVFKNFLQYLSTEISDKPILLIAVSSGLGGSMVISELRANAFKNNRGLLIPDHVIVRSADQFETDTRIQKRMEWSIQVLLKYQTHLEHLSIDRSEFKNGMS